MLLDGLVFIQLTVIYNHEVLYSMKKRGWNMIKDSVFFFIKTCWMFSHIVIGWDFYWLTTPPFKLYISSLKESPIIFFCITFTACKNVFPSWKSINGRLSYTGLFSFNAAFKIPIVHFSDVQLQIVKVINIITLDFHY